MVAAMTSSSPFDTSQRKADLDCDDIPRTRCWLLEMTNSYCPKQPLLHLSQLHLSIQSGFMVLFFAVCSVASCFIFNLLVKLKNSIFCQQSLFWLIANTTLYCNCGSISYTGPDTYSSFRNAHIGRNENPNLKLLCSQDKFVYLSQKVRVWMCG